MNLINLTPNTIHILTDHGELSIPSSGVARIETRDIPARPITVDGHTIYVVRTFYGAVSGLPEYSPGKQVAYIIEPSVAMHPDLRTRPDLFVPNDFIRDDNGNIIAAANLRSV